MTYTALHVHTEYSKLDGASKIEELVARVIELDQDAVAITDHGNVGGHLTLQNACDKTGTKPIFGMEGYFCDNRFDKSGKKGENYDHMTVLALNNTGLSNLWALSSMAFSEGLYYGDPRFDWDLLKKYSEGLAISGGCMGGCVGKFLNPKEGSRSLEKAVERIGGLLNIFKDNFFLEIIPYESAGQREVNRAVIQLGEEYSIPIVATPDSHYLRSEDWILHETITAIGMKKTLEDEKRLRHDEGQLSFPSEDEIRKRLSYLPAAKVEEALANSALFAAKADARIKTEVNMPVFFSSFEEDSRQLKKKLAEGFNKRIIERLPEEDHERYWRRLDYELGVINSKKFDGYFLTVEDLVRWSKENGLLVGPSRGSVGGSLVAYCLGITEIDPIRYGLIFERFLNPGRTSLPDIDLDFPANERVIARGYLEKKYGADNVASIGTYTVVGLKMAIKDLARAQGINFKDANDISKAIEELAITEDEIDTLDTDYHFKFGPWIGKYPQLFKDLPKYLGHLRNNSVHASGVVFSKDTLIGALPLLRDNGSSEWVTQQDMHDVEKEGFVKLDMLVVRNLSTLMKAFAAIRANVNSTFPHFYEWQYQSPSFYEDEGVWDSIDTGKNIGCFQIESAGLRREAVRLRPRSIEDLAALIAAYRPGLLDAKDPESGLSLFELYVQRKNGSRETTYLHPIHQVITESTYGCLLYQEQCIRLCTDMAGYTTAEADDMRSYIGKKNAEKLNAERPKFISGCTQKGVSEEIAEIIFDEMAAHGRYSFNASHSIGYAILAYWTAYLKFHFPTEYMTALLQTNPSRASVYIRECRRMGIDVLGPDINESRMEFSQTANRVIRYGLGQIKWAPASTQLQDFRPFTSIQDIVERVDKRILNKRAFYSLALVGAMDSLAFTAPEHSGYSKMQDILYEYHVQRKDWKTKDSFHYNSCIICEGKLTEFECMCEELRVNHREEHELERLGVLVGQDILTRYADILLEETDYSGFTSMLLGSRARVGGVVVSITKKIVKNGANAGKEMAIIQVQMSAPLLEVTEDTASLDEAMTDDMVELVVFAGEFEEIKKDLQLGVPAIFLVQRLDHSLAVKKMMLLTT